MNNEFIIPLNGLAVGKNGFSWHADREFFVNFENIEVLDAQLDIDTVVEKSGRYIGVDCDIIGWVVVECDRCLEELKVPVDVQVKLSVKFGDADSSDEIQDGEREVVFIPVDNTELDMGQVVYDYVCTSLPIQRVHEDGGCNPETMRYYGEVQQDEVTDEMGENNPFAALKDMFK